MRSPGAHRRRRFAEMSVTVVWRKKHDDPDARRNERALTKHEADCRWLYATNSGDELVPGVLSREEEEEQQCRRDVEESVNALLAHRRLRWQEEIIVISLLLGAATTREGSGRFHQTPEHAHHDLRHFEHARDAVGKGVNDVRSDEDRGEDKERTPGHTCEASAKFATSPLSMSHVQH